MIEKECDRKRSGGREILPLKSIVDYVHRNKADIVFLKRLRTGAILRQIHTITGEKL